MRKLKLGTDLFRIIAEGKTLARNHVGTTSGTKATLVEEKPVTVQGASKSENVITLTGNTGGESSVPFVRDTTAPSVPTGITAAPIAGGVIVNWDGSLADGIPPDFAGIEIYIDSVKVDSNLAKAGSIPYSLAPGGHIIKARSFDQAHNDDLEPAPNYSEFTADILVAVTAVVANMRIMYALGSSSETAPTTGWSETPPAPQDDMFLWQRVDVVNDDDTVTEGVPVCIQGSEGRGIISTTVRYQGSTSGTEPPTGAWVADPPEVADGDYLWTRTMFNFSDGTDSVAYAISKMGEQGATGATGPQGPQGDAGEDGLPGAPGVGITNTTITYAVSASGTTAPTSGWVANPPTATAGQFMWTRTVWLYSDASTETGYSVGKIGNTGATGATGATGPQGVPGPAGADGVSRYTWIKYADTPTTGMSDSPTGKAYIGLAYNKTTATESTVYADYSWSKVLGDQGPQGPDGDDGQSLYTWVKYGTSSAGAGMSDDPTGKTYIGLAYNKTTATESTTASDYTWSLIQGPEGPQGDQGPQGPTGATGATGSTGAAGAAAVVYSVDFPVQTIGSYPDGSFSPPSFIVYSYSKTGSNNRALYAGRMVVDASADGSAWTNVYAAPTSNSSSRSIAMSTVNAALVGAKFIRVSLYAAGGTSNLLQQTAIGIVVSQANYLVKDASGLYMCENEGDYTVGSNTKLDSSGLEVRSGTTALAQFFSSVINLGMNAVTSVINLCGNTGQIGVVSGMLLFFADKIGLRGTSEAVVAAEESVQTAASTTSGSVTRTAGMTNDVVDSDGNVSSSIYAAHTSSSTTNGASMQSVANGTEAFNLIEGPLRWEFADSAGTKTAQAYLIGSSSSPAEAGLSARYAPASGPPYIIGSIYTYASASGSTAVISANEIFINIVDLINGNTSGDLKDFVIEGGTSGAWKYRKWASGVVECWVDVVVTFTQSGFTPSGIYLTNSVTLNFPFAFAFVNDVNVSFANSECAALLSGLSTTSLSARLWSWYGAFPVTGDLRASVRGTWK